jgi:hypothetical protein
MSLAAETREAVRAEPFLYDALRAGVLNYTAAARHLALGEEEAVAAALRRYREDLPGPEDVDGGTGGSDRDARVTMRSGLGPTGDPADALLVVGETALADGGGDLTGIQATGDVTAATLGHVLRRLDVEGVAVDAAAACEGTLLVAVGRRDGANALRVVEDAV